MKKILPTDPEATGHDPIQANLACLRQCFPQAFTEGKVDFEVLKQLLGGAVDESPEKYGLTWNGKRKARMEALKTGTGTLRPAPQDSVEWNSTRNILIEGDNLEVLKLLRNSYANQVKLIYIDPPYNTGKDFVYRDDYQDNLRNYKDQQGELGKEANAETSGRFHTNWLNSLYPRLQLSLNLLRSDGLIFVSIDDHELHNLRLIMDDVFGEVNFEGHLHWRRRHNQPNDPTKMIGLVAEHVLVYAKDKKAYKESGVGKIGLTGKFTNPDGDMRGPWASKPWKVGSGQSGSRYKITAPDGRVLEEEWMGDETTYETLDADKRIVWPSGKAGMPRKKYFRHEREQEGQCATNWWPSDQFGSNQDATDEIEQLFGVKQVFDNPKPISLLSNVIQVSNTDSEDVVLDFYAGSGTTGHAVMAQNAADGGQRRYILVQLPEVLDAAKKEQKVAAEFCDQLGKPRNIAELTKERLRRAGKKIKAEHPDYEGDLGFRVFKLDSSNLKAWDPDTQNVQQSLLDAVEHIKADRSTNDVLYELLLKLGLDLAVPMQQKTIAGKVVHAVGGGVLMVCLEGGITTAVAEPLALGIAAWHAELKPEGRETTVIFNDSGFDGDVAKSNLTAILEQRGLKNVRSV